MKRKDALALIKYAGYHGDTAKGMRLYVENRISYQAYIETFRAGARAKKNGMLCTCSQCQQETKEKP